MNAISTPDVVIPAVPHRTHLLKTDPEFFQATLAGLKTFEIRFNDRDFKVGDILYIQETRHTGAEMKAGAPLVYSGLCLPLVVTYVLKGPQYGLAEGWVLLSHLPASVDNLIVHGESSNV